MRRWVRAFATLLAQTVLAQSALAQSCTCPRPTLEELIASERAVAIFSARVVSVTSTEKGKPAVTRLQVGDIIKGQVPRVLELTGVTPDDNACGVDFRPGEVRVVAVYKKGDRWFTDICTTPQL